MSWWKCTFRYGGGGWSIPILTLASCIPITAVWFGRSLLGLEDLEVPMSSVNLLLEGGAVALHSCTIWHYISCLSFHTLGLEDSWVKVSEFIEQESDVEAPKEAGGAR